MFALMLKVVNVILVYIVPCRWQRFGGPSHSPRLLCYCYPCAEKCAVEVLDAAQTTDISQVQSWTNKHKRPLVLKKPQFRHSANMNVLSITPVCSASSTQWRFKENKSIIKKDFCVFQWLSRLWQSRHLGVLYIHVLTGMLRCWLKQCVHQTL